ncbi:MAG: M28 family peptidase [Vicingaceae bacterium]
MKTKLIYLAATLLIIACGQDEQKKEQPVTPQKPTVIKEPNVEKPAFNADSAYAYVKAQVDFGPRFPNNEAHGKCAKYLESKLKSFGMNAFTQIGKATTFNKKEITIKNIIGEYNPKANKRILLFAHWDSRPFADQDTKNMTKPILGANDGASGVGVLLEVARQLSISKPEIGVDIIFFDAEDYGQPSGISDDEYSSNTWCLGSQYWANNLHQPGYKPEFGILLDMVGGSNPQFMHEAFSNKYAPQVVQKVWANANKLGYGNYFLNSQTGYLIDDHKFVNEIAGIPSIDIIHYENHRGSFHPTWHTHHDNMDIIDKNSLAAVGQVLLYTIKQESK